MTTPSEALVEMILPLLVERKLFTSDDAVKHKTKLGAGNMKAEDWLLVVEKAHEKEASK